MMKLPSFQYMPLRMIKLQQIVTLTLSWRLLQIGWPALLRLLERREWGGLPLIVTKALN